MRIIYDDTMLPTLKQALETFMDELRPGHVIKNENGMPRAQRGLLKRRLDIHLGRCHRNYHMQTGNRYTCRNGIGNNRQYPVYYLPEGTDTDLEICALINMDEGLYGELYVNLEDYDCNTVSDTYVISEHGVKRREKEEK